MKQILVLAYQCSPYRGSEYSVAWNYIVNMSVDNRLFVLYGTSGDHMGDFRETDEYLNSFPISNVSFIKVEPNRIASALNRMNRKGILTYSFYLAYRIWHRQVYEKAKCLLEEQSIDIIHYLTPIGYREPGLLWKLGKPYIWGPVGGSLNYPLYLSKGLPFSKKIKFLFRTVANSLQMRFSIRVAKAIQNTDVFLTATSADSNNFMKYFHAQSMVLPENCITKMNVKESVRYSGTLNVAFVGSIDERKNCRLLLDALALVKHKENINLHIVGDGPQKHILGKYSTQLGLDSQVTWYGRIPRSGVLEIYQKIHILAITSLCESNPTTVWEALSFGIPILALDHCGLHDTINDEFGFKIGIGCSYGFVVRKIAECLDSCVENPETIENMSTAALSYAKMQLWESRVNYWNRTYNLAIQNHLLRQ